MDLSTLDSLYGGADAPSEPEQLDNRTHMSIISLEGRKRVETLFHDIVKGLKRQEDNYILLLKALEALATLTGDSRYWTEPKSIIVELHGRQLNKEKPLELVLKEIKAKITMLQNAQKKKNLTDTGRWFNSQALELLEKDRQELERQLRNSQQGTLV